MENLIIYIPYFKLTFEKFNKLSFSESFLNCANLKLSKNFELQTGLKINIHIKLSPHSIEPLNLIYDTISSFASGVSVGIWGNSIKICWKSKSGVIYKLTNEVIDCNDIEFWMEGLDAKLYHQQLYPK
jgi:hypothetical protein